MNKRLSKPIGGGVSKIPSNHAFGIAIDLNSDDGSNGASVSPVAPVLLAHGFTWGKHFSHPDPMHFEVHSFLDHPIEPPNGSPGNEVVPNRFIASRQRVLNRGVPPEAFLLELVNWGREAPPDIFRRNDVADIYTAAVPVLGPWRDDLHRRASMLEVLRVLAGFESSWNWNEGRDITNPASGTLCSEEAGIFQCSGDSMSISPRLRQLLIDSGGDATCQSFISMSKSNHRFALEYCARLLRFTTKHHGPIKSGALFEWLRRDSVDELSSMLAG